MTVTQGKTSLLYCQAMLHPNDHVESGSYRYDRYIMGDHQDIFGVYTHKPRNHSQTNGNFHTTKTGRMDVFWPFLLLRLSWWIGVEKKMEKKNGLTLKGV